MQRRAPMCKRWRISAASAWVAGILVIAPDSSIPFAAADQPLFETGAQCMSCHNGLTTSRGEDVSLGFAWRASMMANSARDPYWQASVRREIMDHPEARVAIEDECSKCHMPMARFEAMTAGRSGEVFAHLPVGALTSKASLLAADGVSCTVCHQITDENLGTRASLVGHFSIDTKKPPGERQIFGPYAVDAGRATIMRSATGFEQTIAAHIQKSELCATCHTLHTKTLGPGGAAIGELPEQVPFEEWRHSSYREEKSCQDCHMPVVEEPAAIASVLGEPRQGLSRHDFIGSNVFMLQMLARYRAELGVEALPQELALAVRKGSQFLQENTARISLDPVRVRAGRLEADVMVTNLAGHKLPSAYPSRRIWLHLRVRDATGRLVFESGALSPSGSIEGNDNDRDANRYEMHYEEIRSPEEVQIYESIMVDRDGAVTTGLLSGFHYAKDNRILPRGFDKATAGEEIAVHGRAAEDADFTGGSDRVRYRVDVGAAPGPLVVEATLWFQSIGFRWAENLRSYDAPETQRFVRYYETMASASGIVLGRHSVTVKEAAPGD